MSKDIPDFMRGFDIDDDYIIDIPLTMNGNMPIGEVAMSNPIEGENNWENDSFWQKYTYGI